MRKIFTALIALFIPAITVQAGNRPIPLIAEFPPDAETCYGRVYDRAYLARHPRQKVVSLYVFRSLTADLAAETQPRPPEVIAKRNIEEERAKEADGPRTLPTIEIEVLVRFKDRPAVYRQEVQCYKSEGEGFHCHGGCEGGSFDARLENGSLIFRQHWLRVQGGCMSGDESAPGVTFDLADDGREFRLPSRPMPACLAGRDKARPKWANGGTVPLRVRFARPGGLCLISRKGKSGNLTVARLSVRTTGALKADDSDDSDGQPNVPVELTARLVGGKAITRSLLCSGSRYVFDCGDGGDSYNGFRLTQAPGEAVTLRDRTYEGGELARLLGLPEQDRFQPVELHTADVAQCGEGR
jgi:hypothetical protein